MINNHFCITNARIVLPDKIIGPADLLIKGGRIQAVVKNKAVPRGVLRIDARGNFVAPGFIDLHIHGDVELIASQQIQGGTTGFLATLHPQRPALLLRDIDQALKQSRLTQGAKVLGLRLEGPFLNRCFCGALPRQCLRQPDINEANRLIHQAQGRLKMVVLAPELNRAFRLIRLLRKNQIIASLGHSGCSFKLAGKSIDAGINHATHIFNRMAGFDHRRPGAIGALLTDNRVDCEVIADGQHVHPAALRILLNCKGLERVSLITDSTQAQLSVAKTRSGDVFKLPDGTLYGTALTLNKAVKNIIKFSGLSLPQAVRLVSLNPAKVLNLTRRKGSIAVGKDADLVILDKNLQVKMTVVEGKIVYQSSVRNR